MLLPRNTVQPGNKTSANRTIDHCFRTAYGVRRFELADTVVYDQRRITERLMNIINIDPANRRDARRELRASSRP